jgi:hypothetical protein
MGKLASWQAGKLASWQAPGLKIRRTPSRLFNSPIAGVGCFFVCRLSAQASTRNRPIKICLLV